MKSTLFGAMIICLVSGCANVSYVLDERKKECEGSPLSTMEHVRMLPDMGRTQGMMCFSRAVEMKNGEMLYRGVCDFGPKGMHPTYQSHTDDMETCELGKKAVSEDFFVGLAPQERPFANVAQKQEEHVWVIDGGKQTCTIFPMSADQFAASMQKEVQKVCTSKKEVLRGHTLRTIACGDMKTGVGWLLTDEENSCQYFLQSYKQSQESPDL